ncbi:LuxR C-terminal-related transcriptional regulator [Streptomyces sp. NPDC088757]|uniref:helix-turn-helix transcriptional regulator n=1 Tax=Streptomyces sp. NPDC088757 TaxID=3365889 RepID=UPI003816B48B
MPKKEPETEAPLAPLPHLSPTAVDLYRRIAEQQVVRAAELPEVGGSDPEGRRAAVDALLALGLLRPLGADLLAAVSPADSPLAALHAHEARLAAERDQLTRLRDQILVLAAEQESLRGEPAPPLQVLTTLADVRDTITQLTVACRHEVTAAQPGGPRPEKVLSEAVERDLDLLSRGVRLRTLYQYSARFDPPTARHSAFLASHGAEIRTVAGGLARFLVFDREVAVLPLSVQGNGAVVVRSAPVCAFIGDMFDLLWDRSDPIEQSRGRPFVKGLSDQTKQAIMGLLVQGADDRMVSRALGISVRTCQRHVSDIMAKVGAESRLQLGYLIQQHNLMVDQPRPQPLPPQEPAD